jgi:hypothetical protein
MLTLANDNTLVGFISILKSPSAITQFLGLNYYALHCFLIILMLVSVACLSSVSMLFKLATENGQVVFYARHPFLKKSSANSV